MLVEPQPPSKSVETNVWVTHTGATSIKREEWRHCGGKEALGGSLASLAALVESILCPSSPLWLCPELHICFGRREGPGDSGMMSSKPLVLRS